MVVGGAPVGTGGALPVIYMKHTVEVAHLRIDGGFSLPELYVFLPAQFVNFSFIQVAYLGGCLVRMEIRGMESTAQGLDIWPSDH